VMPCGEERSCAVRSDSDGDVPIRSAGPGQAAGLGLAWLSPAASARFFFFSENQFDDFVNPCNV
jgi:hypothetical protein